MNTYSVHYIDRKNFVFALEQIVSGSDAGVLVMAREYPLPPYAAGFEVWRDERLVYRGVVPPRTADGDDPAAHRQALAASA